MDRIGEERSADTAGHGRAGHEDVIIILLSKTAHSIPFRPVLWCYSTRNLYTAPYHTTLHHHRLNEIKQFILHSSLSTISSQKSQYRPPPPPHTHTHTPCLSSLTRHSLHSPRPRPTTTHLSILCLKNGCTSGQKREVANGNSLHFSNVTTSPWCDFYQLV